MRVSLLFFGVLRELAGGPEREIAVPDGATVGDVVQQAERLLPATAIWPRIATAVNQEYVARSFRLREGDVVALLPPVSGGSEQAGTLRTRSMPRTGYSRQRLPA